MELEASLEIESNSLNQSYDIAHMLIEGEKERELTCAAQ